MPEKAVSRSSPTARRPLIKFLLLFGVWIALFSILLRIPWVNDNIVLPMTTAIAWTSNGFLRAMGFGTQASGTIVSGPEGFAVNILKGCDGAYVIAIYLSAVFAFPAGLKQKLIGTLIGIPAVQAINLTRIVSLYYIGARHPDLFDLFHYHVWQTIVIVLSMAVWIAWAEIGARSPR